MYKIQLQNQSQYELINYRFQIKDNLLEIILLDDELNFNKIESDFNNTSIIKILNTENEVEDIIEGFDLLYCIQKYKNYLIDKEIKSMDGGGYHIKEIRKPTYVILLSRSDSFI